MLGLRLSKPVPLNRKKNTYKQRYGLRLGADLSKPAIALFDKNYWGVELMSDYRLNYQFYGCRRNRFGEENNSNRLFLLYHQWAISKNGSRL
ncbi:DUF6048 family protein [Capnocytophaga canimorsus]|nr:DUF6048 family protein [Capnocytophaga canimorsus]WGU69432.1 DUF6048 family protein [Capnocytophaga canimorsus]